MTVVSNFESLDQLEEMLKMGMGMGMGMGQIDGILGGQGGRVGTAYREPINIP